jgi:hypothetical protein
MNVISLDDPVYAAIRQYRMAVAAFNNYRGPEDDYYYELEDAFFNAQDEFWHSVPTTPEGVKAKISVFLNETTEGTTEEAMKDFLDTLYKAACLIDSA